MKQKLRSDVLLILALLLAAALLYAVFRPGGDGAWAVVTADGRETARYPLDTDCTVTLGGDGWNVLQISGRTAAVIDANCGDLTCVRTGAIRREGEMIVCLPHRLTVRIEGGAPSGVDGVSG